MTNNIYISSAISKDFKDVVDVAGRYDVNIEIKTFTKKRNLEIMDEILPEYKNILKDFQGKIALHAPFDAVYKITQRDKKREIALKRYEQALYLAKSLNAETVVFHSGFSVVKEHMPGYKKKFIAAQVSFWKNYIKDFEEAGIIAVLENTNESNPEMLIEIVDKVNSNNLKLCIDTGHINHKVGISTNVSEWINKEQGRLHHMHLHNNYGLIDEHNSLLKGSLNFNKIFRTLQENNLKPNLSLEVNDCAGAIESIQFLRNNALFLIN